MTIVLPSPPRRAWLLAFWLTLSGLTTVATGAIALLFVSPGWAVVAAAPIMVVAALCPLRSRWLARVYEAWNRLALLFARGASLLVRGLAFFAVIAAAGSRGSALPLERPGLAGSLWNPRTSRSPHSYRHQHLTAALSASPSGWLGAYLQWCWQSGNAWAACLAPFWALIGAFEIRRGPDGVPTHTYTLY